MTTTDWLPCRPLVVKFEGAYWPTTPQPSPAVVFPRVVMPDEAAALREHLDHAWKGLDSTLASAHPPAEWIDRFSQLVRRAGAHFGLPVNGWEGNLGRYLPGADYPWHFDQTRSGRLPAPRTVSLSILLSESGRDYEGGVFQTAPNAPGPRQVIPEAPIVEVPAGLGDAIAFTAATFHAVTPVTRGRRYVMIVAGSCRE